MQTSRHLVLAAALAALSLPAFAAAPRVIASVTQPPGGLDCDRAAGETEVVYDFQQPRADIKQLSVFVNGKGVPEKDVEQDWPRVTVQRALEPGRNTVEVVATGADKKSTSHKLVVLVGEKRGRDDRDAAIVDCMGDARLAKAFDDDDGDEPWGEELDEHGEVIDDLDEEYDEDVEYVDETVYYGPRYVYYPRPAFSYVYYEPAYYYPWPYYYSTYYYPYRHHYYYGGYRRPGRAYSHGSVQINAGGSHRDSGYRPTRPPTHGGAYDRPQTRAQPDSQSRTMTRSPSRDSNRNRGRAWD